METPQLHPDTTAIRATSHSQFEYEDDDGDEYDENEPEPDLEKDDMMARRTRSFQKTDAARTNKPINRFLPVPGSVKYNVAPVSAMKPLRNRLKLTEKLATERYFTGFECWMMKTLCCRPTTATNNAYFTGKERLCLQVKWPAALTLYVSVDEL